MERASLQKKQAARADYLNQLSVTDQWDIIVIGGGATG